MGPNYTTRRRARVLNSWTLVSESKRLMLCVVESRFEISHEPEDARSIERLRNELDLAETRVEANRTAATSALSAGRFGNLYQGLIQRATTCAERLSSTAPSLLPSDRLRTAIRVQALDELVDHWRDLGTNQA